jgi:signal transduction histidine kinase/DNA-binding response OmpR family regulator
LREFLPHSGEMAARIRTHNWSGTSLGPIERWPSYLRYTVSALVSSKAQIVVFWGPDRVVLYNDAYRPVFGGKHPWAFGRPGREAWREVWDFLGPVFDGVVQTGEAYSARALPFFIERHQFTEETYFDISYDPVRDDNGDVAGIYCIVTEVTGTVLGERRLALLRELGRPAAGRQLRDVATQAIDTLARQHADIPYAALYLRDADHSARAVASCGVTLKPDGGRLSLDLIGHAAATVHPAGYVTNLPDTARQDIAVLVPLETGTTTLGVLLAGVSRHNAYESGYADFFNLVGSAVGSALIDADALEAERRRSAALAELDRAKTAFFSNVSHEFRTPLTLMLGPTEDALASSRALAGRDLDVLHRNQLRLLKLVNGLLDFARIEAGRMQASYVSTELATFTAELAGMFRSAIDRAGLEFVVHCEPLPEAVYVDRAMWEHVVLNLLSNALKFTFDGRIEVTVRDRGDHVELRVADTGTGIAPEHMPRLFERFHRIEGVRARTHEGSGIGLALVNDLVRLNGGAITANSTVGQGTAFTVTLPKGFGHLPAESVNQSNQPVGVGSRGDMFIQEALRWLPDKSSPTDEMRSLSSVDDTSTATGVKYPPGYILVADDNADMREYLTRLLRQHWTVEPVNDGAAALAAVAQRRPDLILTDVMMPEMDGFELLRRLRTDPHTANIPVVMLSARAGEDARVEGLQHGADDYLIKPFTARELIARVTSQLALAQVRHLVTVERDRFRDLLSQVPAVVNFLRGPDMIFEFVHPLTTMALGGRELLGKPLLEAIPEQRGQPFIEMMQHVYTTGEACSGRERLATFDRTNTGVLEESYWNFLYLPVRAPSGEIEGVMTFDIDVSEQVRSRRKLEEQALDLAHAREEAERASRAKDEFLAMLGHELRNPLAPILTALQLMKLRGLQSREQDIIGRQVGHLSRLVDDLLDVARITRGKIELSTQPMELSDVVLRAMEMASPLLEQRQHQVDVSVPRSGLAVEADRDRLAQVIANLLTNAAKYSEVGSRIVVSARRENGVVRLGVRDEGIGIAPEMLQHVFEPFVQQPQTLDRARGGLGLGLTIVRSLTQKHGGTVHVESEGLGHGSEFIVRLPAIEMPDADNQLETSVPSAPRVASASSRVLVVDDNVDAADMLRRALETLGFAVEVAHDGPSALEQLQTFAPDIAVLDIGLPVMDGYELARRLRGERGNIRLIAVTGYGLESDRERSSGAGFDAHLVKPIDLAQLAEALAAPRTEHRTGSEQV